MTLNPADGALPIEIDFRYHDGPTRTHDSKHDCHHVLPGTPPPQCSLPTSGPGKPDRRSFDIGCAIVTLRIYGEGKRNVFRVSNGFHRFMFCSVRSWNTKQFYH